MDAQDIRNLQEAYLGVYQELDEGSGVVTGTAKAINTVLRPAGQTSQQRDAAVSNITRGLNVVAKPIKSVLSAGPEKNKEMMQKRRPLNQDVDLFDIIKGHLMSEGYADTEEAALAIMANMSEEWRQSIVEDNSTGATKTVGGQTFRDYNSDGLSDRQKRMKEFGDKRLRSSLLKGV
jgi:hypothetical protein